MTREDEIKKLISLMSVGSANVATNAKGAKNPMDEVWSSIMNASNVMINERKRRHVEDGDCMGLLGAMFVKDPRVVRVKCEITLELAYCGGPIDVRYEIKGSTRVVEVMIKPCTRDGLEIVIVGMGIDMEDFSPPGDLIVVIAHRKHVFYTVDGDDLHCAISVSLQDKYAAKQISFKFLDDTQVVFDMPGPNVTTRVVNGRGFFADADLHVSLKLCLPETVQELKEHVSELQC